MNSSPKPTRICFAPGIMRVELADGTKLEVPLADFPRLLHATPEQREQVRLSNRGLHWESLDEDISIAGLLAGQRDHTSTTPDRSPITTPPQ